MYRPTEISTSNPTINDDYSVGYRNGNYWYNTSSDNYYVLVDETTGAADWRLISSGTSTAWADWVPVFTWTGGTPTMSYVARYMVVNKTVHFTLLFEAANSSGSTATHVSVSLPTTPKDNNNAIPIISEYALTAISSRTDVYGTMMFYIDCADNTGSNRKLYCVPNFQLLNGETYSWIMEGFYEID